MRGDDRQQDGMFSNISPEARIPANRGPIDSTMEWRYR